MPSFQTNALTPTYWLTAPGFKSRTQDPLGIDSSSAVIISNIFPSITTVSPRVRYFGFYCWLLSIYEQRIGHKDSVASEQYDFINKCEFLTLFITKHFKPNSTFITGKQYFLSKSKEFDEGVSLSLSSMREDGSKNADSLKDYNGPLNNLKWLNNLPSKFVELLPEGKTVAKAFDESIPSSQKKLFLDIIENDQFSIEDIKNLTRLDLSSLEYGSAEWSRYVTAFINTENPRSKCGESLLDYLICLQTPLDFPKKNNDELIPAYYLAHKDKVNFKNSSCGWLLYSFQMHSHISLLHLLSISLFYMGEDLFTKSELVDYMADKFKEEFNHSNSTVEEYLLSFTHTDLQKLKLELIASTKSSNYPKSLELCFVLFLSSYFEANDYLDYFRDYLKENNLDIRRGSIFRHTALVDKHRNVSCIDFFKVLCHKILSDHQRVGFERMDQYKTPHLFTSENHHLLKRQGLKPNYAGTRLRSGRQFLIDLGLIDAEKNALTNNGITFLQKYTINANI